MYVCMCVCMYDVPMNAYVDELYPCMYIYYIILYIYIYILHLIHVCIYILAPCIQIIEGRLHMYMYVYMRVRVCIIHAYISGWLSIVRAYRLLKAAKPLSTES